MHQTVQANLDRIRALCESRRIGRLWLFGSASGAATRFDDESDFDFVVEIDRTVMPYRGWLDPFFQLTSDLEDLLGRRVQLVEMDSIKKQSLRDAILQQRELIYDGTRAIAAA